MKLRTIALAGLLGTGLMMTSGCGSVEDAIADALRINVVHVANGATNQVEFDIEGELDSNSQLVDAQKSKMFIVSGQDTYTVNNKAVDAPRNFAKDSAHLYALCADDRGVMTDSATGGTREIEVFNLSTQTIGTSAAPLNITLYGAQNNVLATATAASSVGNCNKESVTFNNPFDLVDVKKVGLNDINITVPEYDADVQSKIDSLNDVDFDIVIFDANISNPKGTIVPLATAKELGKD